MTWLLWVVAIASIITFIGTIMDLTSAQRLAKWEAKQAKKRAKRDAEWVAYIKRSRL